MASKLVEIAKLQASIEDNKLLLDPKAFAAFEKYTKAKIDKLKGELHE